MALDETHGLTRVGGGLLAGRRLLLGWRRLGRREIQGALESACLDEKRAGEGGNGSGEGRAKHWRKW
jgi:hypothetical protein